MLTEGGFEGDFGTIWFPRCHFGDRTGGLVNGWPAKGGYYTLLCSVAELEFLNLDRFKPTNRSENAQEEEAHCAKMRQLGARWYRDPYEEVHDETSGIERLRLYVGYPADGGVWAIQATPSQSRRKGLGRINNAFTMEERWHAIKELGGTFYSEPKDCPYLDLDDSKEGEKK
ncbi:hypothetical protein FAVG1_11369 [Fusarium avenaceum]|nr:hypothetical protein FAVG1_11369 [Fusarium avenaceum]